MNETDIAMSKALLLRLHRWLSLALALPLAVLIITGLILSFEPIAQTASLGADPLPAARLEALLAQHDPGNKARAISLIPYEHRLTLQGVGPGNLDIDIRDGSVIAAPGGLSTLFRSARGLHEHLIGGFGWLVPVSTAGMLLFMGFGVFMGLPRINATMGGVHKAIAWFGLPLLIASPLTGLLLMAGIGAGTPGPRAEALPVREAVQVLAKTHDPASLIWLRQRGGRQLARLNEGGTFRVYAVTRDGLVAQGSNWPRLFHEGNFAGLWSGAMNVIISLAFAALLVTGVTIWARRTLRRRMRRQAQPHAA